MDEFFKAIAAVNNPFTLVAFAVAALVIVVTRLRGRVPRWVPKTVILLVLIGVGSWAFMALVSYGEKAIYRVRVTVLSPESTPVDDAQLWSSIGGEPKRVAGGWQFDIPAASRPTDGRLVVYAKVPSAFLSGRAELALETDFNPTAVVRLGRDTSATVSGIVTDETGKAIEGVRVWAVGYETEGTITGKGGNFRLPAHAADGQQVLLYVEARGYVAVNEWHPAGLHPVTIVLHRGR